MLKMTLAELNQIRDECRSLVNQRSLVSAAVAVVPLPGLDVGADVAIMTRMVELINEKFQLTPAAIDQLDPNTRQRVLVIVTSIGSALIGKWMSKELIILALKRVGVRIAAKQAAKIVPLLGSALAAGISYGAMRMLGNAHIDDCYRVLLRTLQEDQREAAAQDAAIAG